MKRVAHLLIPGPEDVEGGFVRNSCCCWMGSVWGDKSHKRKRGHPCNISDKAFKSLRTPTQHTIWQHSGHAFVCKGFGKKKRAEILYSIRNLLFCNVYF